MSRRRREPDPLALSPEQLDELVCWAERTYRRGFQQGVEYLRDNPTAAEQCARAAAAFRFARSKADDQEWTPWLGYGPFSHRQRHLGVDGPALELIEPEPDLRKHRRRTNPAKE